MYNANTNYSFNPWMQDLPIQATKPNDNDNEDKLRFQALISQLSMSDDQIRQIRPTVGNVPFPPRTGYEQRALTIQDVLSLNANTLRQDTYSKQDTGQPGTSTPSLGSW